MSAETSQHPVQRLLWLLHYAMPLRLLRYPGSVEAAEKQLQEFNDAWRGCRAELETWEATAARATWGPHQDDLIAATDAYFDALEAQFLDSNVEHGSPLDELHSNLIFGWQARAGANGIAVGPGITGPE